MCTRAEPKKKEGRGEKKARSITKRALLSKIMAGGRERSYIHNIIHFSEAGGGGSLDSML